MYIPFKRENITMDLIFKSVWAVLKKCPLTFDQKSPDQSLSDLSTIRVWCDEISAMLSTSRSVRIRSKLWDGSVDLRCAVKSPLMKSLASLFSRFHVIGRCIQSPTVTGLYMIKRNKNLISVKGFSMCS